MTGRDRGITTCKPATFSPRHPPPVLAMYLCAWCDAPLDTVAKWGCQTQAGDALDRDYCDRRGWGQLKRAALGDPPP